MTSLSSMTFDALHTLLNERRSIRYFSEKILEKSIIEKLIEVGIQAPSVENTQPWIFHIIRKASLKNEVMKCSCYGNFIAGAATFIVIGCDRSRQKITNDTIWNPQEMEYSCVAAIQNIVLAATTMGIGSCWVSLHHGPVHNLLKLKDHEAIVGGLMLGYLKEGEEPDTDPHERRPLNDVLIYQD